MKKTNIILLASALVIFISCGKKSDLIIGSWKLIDLKSEVPNDMPDSLKTKEAVEIKEEAAEKKKISYDFHKDGTYSMGDKKGTWTLNEQATELTIIDDEKKKEHILNVLELSKSKIVASVMDDKIKDIYTLAK